MIGAAAWFCESFGWRPGRHDGDGPAYHGRKPATVITGATENISLALAHEYAKSGYDLLLIARDSVQLAVQKQDIEVRHNVSVYYLAAGLSEIGSSAFGDRALEDSDFLKMFGRRSPPTIARIT